MNLLKYLKYKCKKSIKINFPNINNTIVNEKLEITKTNKKIYGDYQCNISLILSKNLKINPMKIAYKIKLNINNNNNIKIIKHVIITKPGFINFKINIYFFNKLINRHIKNKKCGIPTSKNKINTVIDFSSPNMSKDMHIGHLRSTIIGDSISKIIKLLGHKIKKINHIGDWGINFGMIINYIKTYIPNFIHKKNVSLNEVENIYITSKKKINEDNNFKLNSEIETIKLQKNDKINKNIWRKVCDITKKEHKKIYNLLNVNLIEKGESYYNDNLSDIIKHFEKKNLITLSNKEKCIYMKQFIGKNGKTLPLIIEKKNNIYNYSTTDLAALKNRIENENYKWIIYVTDIGQKLHFKMVFKAGEISKILKIKTTKINHVTFGLILKDNGKKFQTRHGNTEKLIKVLKKSIYQAEKIIKEKKKFIKKNIKYYSKHIGINAIKYFDLSVNKENNYKFNYEKMLKFNGNTATFITYAYVRIESIKNKNNNKINLKKIIKLKKIFITNNEENELAIKICEITDIIEKTINTLNPNKITEYLYKITEKLHYFIQKHKVNNSKNNTSRLLICELISKIIKIKCKILGLHIMKIM